MNIQDNPELQAQLAPQDGEQSTGFSQPDAPKQADVANFEALSGANGKSGSDAATAVAATDSAATTDKASATNDSAAATDTASATNDSAAATDTASATNDSAAATDTASATNDSSAAATDEPGNPKGAETSQDSPNAGNAQQADRPGQNTPAQQDEDDRKAGKTEGEDDTSKSDKAITDKMDAEAKKQDKVSSLMSRIGQLQQQLSHVEVQISTLQGGGGQENASGEDPAAQIGQLSSQRNMLSSMVQSLQQELMAAQSG